MDACREHLDLRPHRIQRPISARAVPRTVAASAGAGKEPRQMRRKSAAINVRSVQGPADGQAASATPAALELSAPGCP